MLFSLSVALFFSGYCVNAQESHSITVYNWTKILTGDWMVEFYAPWCPACRLVAPEWKIFASLVAEQDAKVADIDCSSEPAVAMIFTITSLPTIFHVKDGVFRVVKNKRKADELLNFIKNREFELIEPMTWSFPPDAFYMPGLVRFLDLGLSITKVHKTLKDWGFPGVLSLVIVGTAVLASGAVMGMLILCVCEYFCPPRPQILNVVGMEGEPPEPIVSKENDKDQDSVLDDSEDNSWTEVKPTDTGESGVEEESPAVHRRITTSN